MSNTNKKQASKVATLFLKQAESSQLEIGKKVEKEHEDVYNKLHKYLNDNNLEMPMTRDEFFTAIAKVHIEEVKDYYTKLLKYVEPKKVHKEALDFSSISSLITPDKKLSGRELERAVRLSISAEHDAVHLYELIADATDNKDVKKIMQDVANEEKVHSYEFQKLLEILSPEENEQKEEAYKEIEEIIDA
jgi:rubrerythrin